MPDFDDANLTFPSNALIAYSDSASPPRTNPLPGVAHRYQRIDTLVPSIEFKATVGGVLAPADGELGGRLFSWWWVEWPGWPGPWSFGSLPPILSVGGKTSHVEANPFPDGGGGLAALGHWSIMCRRDGGGGIIIPFDVEQVI